MHQFITAGILSLGLIATPAFANVTPKPIKTVAASAQTTNLKSNAEKVSKININTATAVQLSEGLHGVGIKKAEAIVAYRKANGPFKSVADIVQVKGIGPAMVEKNLPKMSIR
jgi:competence protein ComEA